MSQCHNIPRVITKVKPKPIIEISSRLKFLSYAIFEAYASEDGKHDMSREENMAFFL
ncbi:hypothetical protein CsSME_00037569 [Camellia sinensis var. sinensis]